MQNSPRSVLISINTSWNIVNFRAALLHSLRESGYRVMAAAPEDAYSERLAAQVDHYHPLPMDNAGTSPLRDAWLIWRYWRLLRRTRPSVLLTYTIKPNIYGTVAASLCGIPVIANISGLGTAFLHRHWKMRIVRPLYRFSLKRVQRVFFQNTADQQLFVSQNLVAPHKTSVLPGSGIDLAHFHPRFNLPSPDDAPPRFVLIARLLLDKGIGEYVAAARMVKAQHPQARFALVGPRGVANKTAVTDAMLEAWVTEGVVDYLGETDDVRSVLAAQDCVVLPSYREGMSRVLLEGAAMGKPLITTDVPGCRDVVTSGENGFLCPPRNAEDLAQQMLRFIALSPAERLRMGERSRAIAETRFDERHVITAYLAAIGETSGSTTA